MSFRPAMKASIKMTRFSYAPAASLKEGRKEVRFLALRTLMGYTILYPINFLAAWNLTLIHPQNFFLVPSHSPR